MKIKKFEPINSLEESKIWAKEKVDQLTLEEKIKLIGGERIFFTNEVERLGITKVFMSDATMGNHIRFKFGEVEYENAIDKAVSFPSSITLASSWNKELSKDDIKHLENILWQDLGTEDDYINDCDIKIHPTQKPVKLYEWLLMNYAKPNDKILDTHLGSGSIAIAIDNVNKIEQMNLELTACELDKEYFEASLKRIEQQTKQQKLF